MQTCPQPLTHTRLSRHHQQPHKSRLNFCSFSTEIHFPHSSKGEHPSADTTSQAPWDTFPHGFEDPARSDSCLPLWPSLPHATALWSPGTGPTGHPPGCCPREACPLGASGAWRCLAVNALPRSPHRSDGIVSERQSDSPSVSSVCFLHSVRYSMCCPCSCFIFLLVNFLSFSWASWEHGPGLSSLLLCSPSACLVHCLRKPRLWVVKQLAQDHTAGTMWSRDLI